MTTPDYALPMQTARAPSKPWRWRPAPDLQALVAQHGRFDLIPDAAWARWDAEMAAYRAVILPARRKQR